MSLFKLNSQIISMAGPKLGLSVTSLGKLCRKSLFVRRLMNDSQRIKKVLFKKYFHILKTNKNLLFYTVLVFK